MSDYPHKIQDVLEININGTITSCIVIDFKFNHVLAGDDLYFMCRSIAAFEFHWPRSPLILKTKQHSIYNVHIENTVLKNCYELLIGDQKVWLQYDNSL